MIHRSDKVIEDIYSRVKHLIDNIYRKKGLTSEQIKRFLSINKNFREILKTMPDLQFRYNENPHDSTFEEQVKDILFNRILMDRIYYEKDNPQNENHLKNYREYIKESHLDVDPFGEEDWDDKGGSVLMVAKEQELPFDQITLLDCGNKYLNSLDGIENLINLEVLQCDQNRLTNLNGIENLTKLEILNCGNNQLTSLEGIENLTNIEYLYCYQNQLTKIDGLENLKRLEDLNCFDNLFSYEYIEYLKDYCKKNKIDLTLY